MARSVKPSHPAPAAIRAHPRPSAVASPCLRGSVVGPLAAMIGKRVEVARTCWDRQERMHLHPGTKGVVRMIHATDPRYLVVSFTATLELSLLADDLRVIPAPAHTATPHNHY